MINADMPCEGAICGGQPPSPRATGFELHLQLSLQEVSLLKASIDIVCHGRVARTRSSVSIEPCEMTITKLCRPLRERFHATSRCAQRLVPSAVSVLCCPPHARATNSRSQAPNPALALPTTPYWKHKIIDGSLLLSTTDTPDKEHTEVAVKPTPKANREKLGCALEELLNLPPANGSTHSDGSMTWLLDSAGDKIHRHFFSADSADKFVVRVLSAADEIHHHPHITRARYKNMHCLTITCTTHQPPGLGMRDIRLARKIDELAHELGMSSSWNNMTEDETVGKSPDLRSLLKEGIRKNYEQQCENQCVKPS